MLRFLRYICLGMLTLGLTLFGLETLVNTGLRHSQEHQYREMSLLTHGQILHDICILGSSRAEVNMNPDLIEIETGLSCYNLGWAGACLTTQQIIRHHLFAQDSLPKIIVQTVDLLSFGKRSSLYQPERFYPYLQDQAVDSVLSLIDPTVRQYRWLPMWEYRGQRQLIGMGLLEYLGRYDPHSQYVRRRGFTNYGSTYSTDNIEPDWTLEVSDQDMALGAHWLKGLIDSCQTHRITLVLVYPPLYKDVFAYYNQGDYQQVRRLFEEMGKEEGVWYWDMAQDSSFASQTMFQDPYHLNQKGAERFSRQVGQQLAQLYHAPDQAMLQGRQE